MIAVIGCGYWGKNLIRNFADLGVLSAICEVNDILARQFSDRYKVPSLSYEQILLSPEIKGVALAADPSLNAEYSLKALQSGKHVFVEKPHVFTRETAKSLDQFLAKNKPTNHQVFMVGHLLLYHTAFLKVKHLLHTGRIGRVKEIRCFRHGLGRVRNDFSVLWELAPHDLSLILDLNPFPVTHIDAVASQPLTQNWDAIRVLYHFANGVTAQLSCSWTDPMKQQQLIIQGEKGFIIFDDTRPWSEKVHVVHFEEQISAELINKDKYMVEGVPIEQEEVLRRECSHFLECIQETKEPLTGITQAQRVFNLLDQTQEVLNKKKQGCLAVS